MSRGRYLENTVEGEVSIKSAIGVYPIWRIQSKEIEWEGNVNRERQWKVPGPIGKNASEGGGISFMESEHFRKNASGGVESAK